MFSTVLVANRGEIAVRVFRALARMGIRSVAVFTAGDVAHVPDADEAVRVGSYLSIEDIVAVARETGAEAVHPGYGFLAENAAFARACAEAGIVFIGPPPEAIEAMGDKIRAKQTVSAAGVPVVPGRNELGMSDADLVAAAEEVGYPVLVKPSAGGGGKGMRRVADPADLPAALESARREARGAFGDDTLLVERFVANPRHIEIQVLADAHGNVIHLGERECSLQRRHQKIIEEAPSPLLDAESRERMGASAADAARAVGYTGAGTVEFIVSTDRPDEFFFMEMNTRLQVEHPVTELVTGIDLVEQQLRVAAGSPLDVDVALHGHAVEARVYAEDPARGFLPTGGRVLAVAEPAGEHVRVDSALRAGIEVGSSYDPMLAKVIAWGPDRESALRRLDAALAGTVVLGVGTNVAFLRALLSDVDVRAGRLDTGLVERKLGGLVSAEVPDVVFAAAALDELADLRPAGDVVDPWDLANGWRLGGPVAVPFRLACGDRKVTVRVTGTPESAAVQIGDAAPETEPEPVRASARRDGNRLEVTYGGRVTTFLRAQAGDTLWLAAGGDTWAVDEHSLLEGTAAGAASGGPVVSPMPGTVLVVKAAAGDVVTAGAPLVVVEAMKMEHTVTAPVDGVVTELHVRAGQQVALNQPLAVVIPQEEQS
jgi:3-methylcrotonyl-CoA carboxylase alpha subunit